MTEARALTAQEIEELREDVDMRRSNFRARLTFMREEGAEAWTFDDGRRTLEDVEAAIARSDRLDRALVELEALRRERDDEVRQREFWWTRACDSERAFVDASARLEAVEAERDRYREALVLAYGAMNHMGDILNNADMNMPEDVEKVTPAFAAARAALAPEAGRKS